jgi:glycosyltransferase involved in cell wall biosynthesis
MNVLYDISALGLIHDKSGFKTGIPRVVETLAYQLAELPECSLELCSSEFLVGSLDYAKANPRFKSVAFSHSKLGASFQRRQRDVQRDVDTASGPAVINAKVKRKILSYVTTSVKASAETLDLESLRSADIYHATFFPLPEQARIVKHPQLFMTIYDMIPVLFPKHCEESVVRLFDRILSSIDKDTWLLSISEFTKMDLCNHLKIDPNRVFVTPLAADTTLFYPNQDPAERARVKEKYKIPNGPYVLSLCTIEPRKNIDHAIRGFVKLVREQKLADLNLVLAGAKGWDYDHIFKEIDGAEAVKKQIVVTGYVANEDLAGLYSGALAFVYPSLYEGFGLPPLEAMQCGTPVITSNTSSLPEVVGDAGIMLDPHDADGLCQSLLSLYQDTSLREELSAKSLARAREFSWKRCAEDTVHAYRTALKS